MHTATVKLKSAAPYSQSRNHGIPKNDGETGDDHNTRVWREHCHYDSDGMIYIPGISVKNAVAECFKYKATQIPGKGKATYTKHFEAGVIVPGAIALAVHKDAVEGERLYLDANGRRGSGTRVWRTYPVIREWAGALEFIILDDTITEPVFTEHLRDAGRFIGIGRWRPRNNGLYGRFDVVSVEWS